MFEPVLEVIVTLRFDKTMVKNYQPKKILSSLFKSLDITLENVNVGQCQPLNRYGVRAFYPNDKKEVLVVESPQSIFMCALNEKSSWQFKYEGPPFFQVAGGMSKVTKFLTNYAGILIDVNNESTFPEFSWAADEVYPYIDIVNDYHNELHSREEEIFNILTVHFNDIEKIQNALLHLEIKENRYTFVNLLVRVMCVLAKLDIRNIAEVIDEVVESKFSYVKQLINMLTDKNALRNTLVLYGANPY